ncbi:MAG: DUF342 domain-containing protein [Eubacteriales bacterium]|jgi:uncharacterized protein (DUF342 family)
MNWIKKLFKNQKTDNSNLATSQSESVNSQLSENSVEPNQDIPDTADSALEKTKDYSQEEMSMDQQELKVSDEDNIATEVGVESPESIVEKEPIDAWAEVDVAADNMSASIVLHGPENGGKDITADDVIELLKSQKIVYGIKDSLISQMVSERRYEERFVGVSGLPVKNGVDGRIIELLPRTKTISFVENDRGDVDFKNLDIVNQVNEGTVICEIVQPEDPVPGKDIFGNEINGRPGVMPAVPSGENTYISEDGTKLIAGKDGNLVYSNNRFSVRLQFEVSNNVDASTGNIDFIGDVIIRGSVLEGYEVKAGGNVVVYGVVEGAHIVAGGNVQLKQGINGMGKGLIEAKGDITSRFFENCTAKAGGSISTEYILHSNIYSGNSINATGSRSSIIGGVCSALQTITVANIGNRMNTMTTIMLGATTEMIEERKRLLVEVSELERKHHNLTLDSRYIESRIQENTLTAKHCEILLRLQNEYPEVSQRLEECRSQLMVLDELISNNTNTRLTCRQMYPPTRISIGREVIIVQEERYRCEVYYSEGEIKFAYR